MEFRPTLSTSPPKILYPCLATLTLGPEKTARRLSMNSTASGDEEGGLRRIISGSRRNTSFGQVADRGDGARKSLDGSANTGALGVEKGTWFWRVQAGVNDTHLVLMPLSQPPNSLLTSAPPPLSEAMPTHSTAPHGIGHAGHTEEHESFGTKVKNLFAGNKKHTKDDTHPEGEVKHETIVDQTGAGEQMPSAAANAMGADNVNANAETAWPGVINGEKLGVVLVSLGSIDHTQVKLHQHKKESCYVTVPVTAHMAGVGQNSEYAPRSGFIKFEFDKEWIGAKGEAELLHHYITTAAQNPPQASQFANQNFQIGGGQQQQHQQQQHQQTMALGGDVAPDQDSTSSGKVPGTAL